MSTPASVATNVPGTAVAPALLPWKSRIHVASDGARVLVYADSSGGLSVKTSRAGQANSTANVTSATDSSHFSVGTVPPDWGAGTPLTDTTTGRGTGIIGSVSGTAITLSTAFSSTPAVSDVLQFQSWSNPTQIVSSGFSGGFSKLVDSCMVKTQSFEALFVFVGQNNGTVDAYKVPYSSGGVLGAVVTQTALLAGLTTVPQSLCCVYDAAGVTIDPEANIVGYTGLIHLLCDSGSRWDVFALDPNTISVTAPWNTLPLKKVLSTYVLPNISGPTYNTNLILRTGNTLYAISPGATRWYAYEIDYASSSSTGSTTQTYADGLSGGAAATVATASQSTGTYLDPQVTNSTVTPGQFRGNGVIVSSTIGGYAFQTGNWTLSQGISQGSVGYAMKAQARIYEKTVGGSFILRVTLPLGSASTPGTGSTAVSCSASGVAGFTMGSLSQLYCEVDLLLATGSFGGTINSYGVTVTAPAATKQVTNTSQVNQYTWGTQEQPTLPLSTYGAAMVPTVSPTNVAGFVPAVDLFCYRADLGQICTQQRYAGGGYSSVFNIGGSNLLAGGCAATYDPATGDEAVFFLATFSGPTHVGVLRRTSGTWGATQAQVDNDATAPVQSFCPVTRGGLAIAGRAVVSVDSQVAPVIWYDDMAFVSGTVGAAQPDQLTLINNTGHNDAFGVVSPFTCTTATPRYQWRFQITPGGSLTNKMSAFWLVVRRQSDNALMWDSGKVGVTNGPLPNGLYSVQHGTVGNAITAALVSGTEYYVTVTTWDVTTGSQSPASVQCLFWFFNPPNVAVDAPASPLTSFSQAFTFDFYEGGYPCTNYDAVVTDASGNVLLDTGIQPVTPNLLGTSTAASCSAGATTVSLNNSYPSGTSLWIFGPREKITTTGAPTGSGPYVHTLTAPLVNTHASGVGVAQQGSTSAIALWPALPNAAAVTLALNLYAQPPAGRAAFYGTATAAYTTAFPAPPVPHDLEAIPTPGVTPLTGGYIALRFAQDAGSGASSPNAATWNLYQRETGQTAWQLVEALPAVIGTNEVHFYSVKCGVPYDLAVSAVSADGVESALVSVLDQTLIFRVGVWLNNLANPKECVELGITDAQSSTYLQWQSHDDAQYQVPMNRSKPVTLFGTESWVDTAQKQQYRLEVGFDRQVRAQLITWWQNKTPLQVRDASGEMLLTVLRALDRGSIYNPNYLGVSVDFTESDPGAYALLVTLP